MTAARPTIVGSRTAFTNPGVGDSNPFWIGQRPAVEYGKLPKSNHNGPLVEREHRPCNRPPKGDIQSRRLFSAPIWSVEPQSVG